MINLTRLPPKQISGASVGSRLLKLKINLSMSSLKEIIKKTHRGDPTSSAQMKKVQLCSGKNKYAINQWELITFSKVLQKTSYLKHWMPLFMQTEIMKNAYSHILRATYSLTELVSEYSTVMWQHGFRLLQQQTRAGFSTKGMSQWEVLQHVTKQLSD